MRIEPTRIRLPNLLPNSSAIAQSTGDSEDTTSTSGTQTSTPEPFPPPPTPSPEYNDFNLNGATDPTKNLWELYWITLYR